MIPINHVWQFVLLFVSAISIYLFYLYFKDKDKRKLVFTIAFFLSIPAFIALAFDFVTLNLGNSSVLWYNIFTLSPLPFLFAVFIASHEQLLKVKNYDKVFNVFILLSALCVVFVFLPFKVTGVPNAIRLIVSLEILAVTIYQFTKTKQIENLYFIGYILAAMAAGIGFGLDYGFFSSFAFLMSYIFICFLFVEPRGESNKKNKGIRSYFSLEQQLKTAEKRYEKLFNNIPDAITVLSADGSILNLNDAMAQNLNMAKAEAMEKNMYELLSDNSNQERIKMGLYALQTGKIQENDDQRSGAYFHNIFIPLDTEDEQKNLMIIHKDITNEKKLEKQREEQLTDLRNTEIATLNIMEDMQETVENLEQARKQILEKNKELKKTNQKLEVARKQLADFNEHLEQKVEDRTQEIRRLLNQKDAFIDQLGHDLKHPLGPFVHLLPILIKKETDEKKLEMLKIMQRNADYMKNLVIRTVKLAKLNAPSTTFKFEPVQFSDLLTNVIGRKTSMFDKFDVEIQTNVDSDLVVNVDSLQIEEVIDNLINNALKYGSEHGSIAFSAKKHDDDQALISVTDTGQGMTEDQLELVFNEFYKADESRHDFTNTGLGLSICKRIIEKHGGNIWAESKGIGKGTTINFTVPLAEKKVTKEAITS